MSDLKTGQLADRAGVNVETVRYYERRGLMPEPPRRDSGYRIYGPEHVERLRFIRRAQELGFTLSDIEDLLTLRVDPDTSCADVRARAESRLADIRQKIQDLRRVEKALRSLSEACIASGPTSACPILEELSGNDFGSHAH